MDAAKIRLFMTLAGQPLATSFDVVANPPPDQRRTLGAQLLLSEVLEYVIHGLGVTPTVNGVAITDPNAIEYSATEKSVEPLEMIDGLADVAYTMYWNSTAFGVPLEEAFELVCDNNLEKFVPLTLWMQGAGPLERDAWHCNCDTSWPPEVVEVQVVQVEGTYYAVGKDQHGKVRKPSHYRSVDLSVLLPKSQGAVRSTE